MIRYKVVNQYNQSCIAPLGYVLKYTPGEITTAREDTLGVMVFKRKKDAVLFIAFCIFLGGKILRVEPIGRGKTPELVGKGISKRMSTQALDFFYESSLSPGFVFPHETFPPPGAICYPAVKVLSECKTINL